MNNKQNLYIFKRKTKKKQTHQATLCYLWFSQGLKNYPAFRVWKTRPISFKRLFSIPVKRESKINDYITDYLDIKVCFFRNFTLAYLKIKIKGKLHMPEDLTCIFPIPDTLTIRFQDLAPLKLSIFLK